MMVAGFLGTKSQIINLEHVIVTKPVGYLETLALEKHAKKIITDSGGVQREAYFAGVPCITLLEFSEWVETVEYGWNFLAGTDVDKILWGIRHFEGGKEHPDLFGDGNAGEKTVSVLEGRNDRVEP
jgi:UDP-N-acetylglucosamine 2-epimerase